MIHYGLGKIAENQVEFKKQTPFFFFFFYCIYDVPEGQQQVTENSFLITTVYLGISVMLIGFLWADW